METLLLRVQAEMVLTSFAHGSESAGEGGPSSAANNLDRLGGCRLGAGGLE